MPSIHFHFHYWQLQPPPCINPLFFSSYIGVAPARTHRGDIASLSGTCILLLQFSSVRRARSENGNVFFWFLAKLANAALPLLFLPPVRRVKNTSPQYSRCCYFFSLYGVNCRPIYRNRQELCYHKAGRNGGGGGGNGKINSKQTVCCLFSVNVDEDFWVWRPPIFELQEVDGEWRRSLTGYHHILEMWKDLRLTPSWREPSMFGLNIQISLLLQKLQDRWDKKQITLKN